MEYNLSGIFFQGEAVPKCQIAETKFPPELQPLKNSLSQSRWALFFRYLAFQDEPMFRRFYLQVFAGLLYHKQSIL
jgi:hypothetical protein